MLEIKPFKAKLQSKTEDAVRSAFTAPYFDLESSIKVARVIYEKGGGSCTADQLANWLDYASTRSGTFLTRVSAANKHFRLIEQNGDHFIITENAEKILAPVMPEDTTNAKAEAFLSAPLFGKVYEQFKGSQLPPEVGLKNLFQSTYKVTPDRVANAVRIFLNSADQAGLLVRSGDRSRLIRPTPAFAPARSAKSPEDASPVPPEKPRGGGGDGPTGVHSAIIGLLRELPPPGTPWNQQKRDQFLLTFDNLIKLLYPAEKRTP